METVVARIRSEVRAHPDIVECQVVAFAADTRQAGFDEFARSLNECMTRKERSEECRIKFLYFKLEEDMSGVSVWFARVQIALAIDLILPGVGIFYIDTDA